MLESGWQEKKVLIFLSEIKIFIQPMKEEIEFHDFFNDPHGGIPYEAKRGITGP